MAGHIKTPKNEARHKCTSKKCLVVFSSITWHYAPDHS